MRRAEVWTAAGASDYAGKPRPAVILQDDAFEGTASMTVCPLTTHLVDAPLIRLPDRAHETERTQSRQPTDGRQDHNGRQVEAAEARREAGRGGHDSSESRRPGVPRSGRSSEGITCAVQNPLEQAGVARSAAEEIVNQLIAYRDIEGRALGWFEPGR